jgi:alkylated DNA nucleotide flippase Atl1
MSWFRRKFNIIGIVKTTEAAADLDGYGRQARMVTKVVNYGAIGIIQISAASTICWLRQVKQQRTDQDASDQAYGKGRYHWLLHSNPYWFVCKEEEW